MKKLLILLMVFSLGCVQYGPTPMDVDRILKTTNAIYMDIRLVVTDPEVMPMFTEGELKALAELEIKYLAAADLLRGYPEDPDAIGKISWIATEILEILSEVAFVSKTRPYVAAIRISIKILQNHL